MILGEQAGDDGVAMDDTVDEVLDEEVAELDINSEETLVDDETSDEVLVDEISDEDSDEDVTELSDNSEETLLDDTVVDNTSVVDNVEERDVCE
jgi:hypothetical protein